ncbi:hypothetical protein TNCV_2671061 [Trichonephila clavipes]|nr:hypothetical protein TNCV_2671061 [Trichonephila clavipes]
MERQNFVLNLNLMTLIYARTLEWVYHLQSYKSLNWRGLLRVLFAGRIEQSLPVSTRKQMLDLRSRAKRRQEVEGKAYVAATPARSSFPGKNRAEYIFLPLWQIYYDTNINLMLLA